MQDPNPYASPQATVEKIEPSAELRLAGRGERLGAVFIDGLLSGAVFWSVMGLTGLWSSYLDAVMSGEQPPWKFLIWMVLGGFATFVVIQGYPLATTGQTWGKRLLSLRIVDMQGLKPDFWRLIALRYGVGRAVAMIPLLGGIYSLTDSLLIFRDDRRCIHDLIAGTRVVAD